jgi:hypothetical protein
LLVDLDISSFIGLLYANRLDIVFLGHSVLWGPQTVKSALSRRSENALGREAALAWLPSGVWLASLPELGRLGAQKKKGSLAQDTEGTK